MDGKEALKKLEAMSIKKSKSKRTKSEKVKDQLEEIFRKKTLESELE